MPFPINSSHIPEHATQSKKNLILIYPVSFISSTPAMSSTRRDCNCADKSQCVKKGNEFDAEVVGTEKSYVGDVMEHNGKCNCGPNCTCTDCSCGN